MRTVLMVLFDQVQSLDVTGPLEVFSGANAWRDGHGDGPAYDIRTASLGGRPVRTSSGLRVTPGEDLRGFRLPRPGLSKFVTRMNATARLLGMRRTHFSNFDGLPYPTPYSNYSTAANLLVLGRAAMRLPAFRSVVAKRGFRLAAGSGHHAYWWKNLNPLLGRYPGAIGIKPGYTGAAGQCLLFEATRNGHSVIGVTLHSPGSISSVNPADATRILNWAFSDLS